MVDGVTHEPGTVSLALEIARQAPFGRLVVVGPELPRALLGELKCPRPLIVVAEFGDGVVDHGLVDVTAPQFGHDRLPAQTFTFVLGSDERLGEGGIVDEAGTLESLDLVSHYLIVKITGAQEVLELPP